VTVLYSVKVLFSSCDYVTQATRLNYESLTEQHTSLTDSSNVNLYKPYTWHHSYQYGLHALSNIQTGFSFDAESFVTMVYLYGKIFLGYCHYLY
jgi:hypothetical protein